MEPSEMRDLELFIMRGPPGCGKSTHARSLLAEKLGVGKEFLQAHRSWLLTHICSTDDFSVARNGFYELDPETLPLKHEYNTKRVEIAMQLYVTPLFVDNTNMQLWEIAPYVNLANERKYTIHIVDPASYNPSWN
eukprot:TRINITY_DN32859_c0_g1_i1.p1 TRINITY_DN32859_c0_g1~~TRINITY_DN32859_c0_g1_i1.p1  ORF type:complete len:135 (+),score=11.64 TRINITY_DN32859_c0_g1_i1:61-465(+)